MAGFRNHKFMIEFSIVDKFINDVIIGMELLKKEDIDIILSQNILQFPPFSIPFECSG